MDPRREAKDKADRRPVVAEDDPDASARDPESRIPHRGLDVPHAEDLQDDAEGAGGRGQPAPGLEASTPWQPGGSPRKRSRARSRSTDNGPGQDSHEGD